MGVPQNGWFIREHAMTMDENQLVWKPPSWEILTIDCGNPQGRPRIAMRRHGPVAWPFWVAPGPWRQTAMQRTRETGETSTEWGFYWFNHTFVGFRTSSWDFSNKESWFCWFDQKAILKTFNLWFCEQKLGFYWFKYQHKMGIEVDLTNKTWMVV